MRQMIEMFKGSFVHDCYWLSEAPSWVLRLEPGVARDSRRFEGLRIGPLSKSVNTIQFLVLF